MRVLGGLWKLRGNLDSAIAEGRIEDVEEVLVKYDRLVSRNIAEIDPFVPFGSEYWDTMELLKDVQIKRDIIREYIESLILQCEKTRPQEINISFDKMVDNVPAHEVWEARGLYDATIANSQIDGYDKYEVVDVCKSVLDMLQKIQKQTAEVGEDTTDIDNIVAEVRSKYYSLFQDIIAFQENEI